MKFTPVVPPGAMSLFTASNTSWFAFATELYRNKPYADIVAARPNPSLLVMDCPVYEGEAALMPSQLAQVIRDFFPNFAIIPDVRHDLLSTLARFSTYFESIPLELREPCTGVLQGQSPTELAICYEEMKLMGATRFAIPKDQYSLFHVSRAEIIDHLHITEPVHLLGANWPYSDERECSAISNVVSVDCAEPFNATYAGKMLNKEPPKRHHEWMKSGLAYGIHNNDFWRPNFFHNILEFKMRSGAY